MDQNTDFENSINAIRYGFNSLSRDLTNYYSMKRIIDVVVSSIALIMLSPLLLIIAALIYFDSPGPVIFIQKRVGAKWQKRNGIIYWERSEFVFYKFRSMVNNADPSIHKAFIKALINNNEQDILTIQNGSSTVKKISNDNRVTRIGRILRKSSLDELPQFWNVLKGDMSLVGPRPAIPYEVEMYKPWYFRRFNSKPGLTGLWQVTARNSVGFDEMMKIDNEYVENQSLWLDLIIFIKTPLVIFLRHGDAC